MLKKSFSGRCVLLVLCIHCSWWEAYIAQFSVYIWKDMFSWTLVKLIGWKKPPTAFACWQQDIMGCICCFHASLSFPRWSLPWNSPVRISGSTALPTAEEDTKIQLGISSACWTHRSMGWGVMHPKHRESWLKSLYDCFPSSLKGQDEGRVFCCNSLPEEKEGEFGELQASQLHLSSWEGLGKKSLWIYF